MSDKLKVSPEIIRSVSLVGAGLVVAGLGSLFALNRGGSYGRLVDFLHTWTNLDERVIKSTIDRLAAANNSLPIIPSDPDALAALGERIEKKLPLDIGGRTRPGRVVSKVIYEVLGR